MNEVSRFEAELANVLARVELSRSLPGATRARMIAAATETLEAIRKAGQSTQADGRVRSGRRDHAVRAKAGDRFGRLTYLEPVEHDPHYGAKARYLCSCGAEVVRICSFVRLQVRRSSGTSKRTGKRMLGPGCGHNCPELLVP